MSDSDAPEFLVHAEGDSVGVATRDLSPGTAHGGLLSTQRSLTIDLKDSVPLGHKFALHDIREGDEVIEYGVCIAKATSQISAGQHAHVHNLRSVRWHNSRAS